MEFLYLLENIRNVVLDKIMLGVTFLGEEIPFMVIGMLLLWCVDKFEGYYMLSVGFVGTQINQLLKVIFRIPRPWVKDPEFKPVGSAIKEATGYSFPSGHTQSATGNFGTIALWGKKNWLRIVMVVLIVLVAFSRMYLGVHTPLDVGVSLLIALVLVFGFYPIVKKGKDNPKVMYALFSGMIVFSLAVVLFMEFYKFPETAIGEELLHGLKTTYKMLGASVGFLVAYHFDRVYIKYDTKAVWWAQIIKVVLGLALSLGVKELCYFVFGVIPGETINRALSYFVMVIFAGAVWPLTFKFFSKLGGKK